MKSPRKLLAALFALIFLSVNVKAATDVVFNLADARLNIAAATNRTVWIQRLSVPDGVNNATVIIGSRMSYTSSVAGSFTVTNLQAGLYGCTVKAPPEQTDFKILVTATNLGTIYAADILAASSSATFPAGAVAWAASVTDGRYSRSTNSLTNYVTLSTFNSTLLGYQPADSDLTNWASLSTNLFVNTNRLNSTNDLLREFALTLSTNATNFALTLSTNATNKINAVGTAVTNALAAQGTVITNIFYTRDNPSNYVTASVTNGYATQVYAQGLTNILYTLLGSAAFSNSAVFYPRSNPSNFVTATVTNELNSRLGTAAFSNASAFYLNSNPSNYISTAATNGLASQTYVQTLTNTLWGLLGTAARSNASAFYLDSNPSNYVTASVTNALNSRLGTAALSNASAFYLNSNPSNYISTAATNGLASQTYVQTLTNTLWGLLGTAARSNASAFYLDSNPSNYVTSSITNALNARLGTAAFSNASIFLPNSLTNIFLPTNNFNVQEAKDVTISSLSAGQGIFWSGTKWTNGPPPNSTLLLADYLPTTNGIATNGFTVKGNLGVTTNAWFNSAVFTNSVTNLALTASRFMAVDANKVETTTAASSSLAGTLSDETGSGVAVFSSGASTTGMVARTFTASNAVQVGYLLFSGNSIWANRNITVTNGDNVSISATNGTLYSLSGNTTNSYIYGILLTAEELAGPTYKVVHFLNKSSTNHVFVSDSTDVTEFRIRTIEGVNVTNRPGGLISFLYDTDSLRWRPLLAKEQ